VILGLEEGGSPPSSAAGEALAPVPGLIVRVRAWPRVRGRSIRRPPRAPAEASPICLRPPPGCFNPSRSPDGTRIIFNRFQPVAGEDIYTVNADGTGLSPAVASPLDDEDTDWGTHPLPLAPRASPAAGALPPRGRRLNAASRDLRLQQRRTRLDSGSRSAGRRASGDRQQVGAAAAGSYAAWRRRGA
jgi:hypothetical protein